MTSRQAPTLLTIGHSNHEIGRFVALLKGAGVGTVVDVRSRPVSRFCPQFNKAALTESLTAAGIGYVFLGEELGGKPDDPRLYTDGVPDFEKMAETEAFREGIERVFELAGGPPHPVRLSASLREVQGEPPSPTLGGGHLALMCSEKHPLDCHRCLLVGRALKARGAEVRHILADGSVVTQSEIEDELLGGEADLLASREERLAAVYRARAKKAVKGKS